MIDKFQLLHIVAGIGWDPEIRGALTVLVGSLVLFGSVWLILNTNLGNRLGTLIALAGFFGWMLVIFHPRLLLVPTKAEIAKMRPRGDLLALLPTLKMDYH